MIRRLLTLACAMAAFTVVSADRAGAQGDPNGPAVQPFKPADLKWVRNAAGTQERVVLFGDPSKPESGAMPSENERYPCSFPQRIR